MAVAALSAPASMTAEQYHRISERLDASRTATPPGRRFHACFGHGDHLMVFDVWDSVEELDSFTATLMPVLASEHIDSDAGVLRKTIAELRDKAFFIRPVESSGRNSTASPGSLRRDQDTPTETSPARDDS